MNHVSSSSDVTPLESMTAGAASGVITRFFTAPLDLVKIRLQVQTSGSVPCRTFRNVRNIVQKEGVRAFWKGNSPAELLYMSYGGVQFFSLRGFNKLLVQTPLTSKLSEDLRQFLAGGTAGMVSTLSTYPFDYLRTKLAVNRGEKYKLLPTIRTIWNHAGPWGFYHGASASVTSVFFYMGAFFAVYSHMQTSMDRSKFPHWFPSIFSASSVAAVVSKVVVFPLDTIRKRVQTYGSKVVKDGATAKRVYSHNVFVCGYQIVSREGISGLYRGVTIAVLKAIPASFLTMHFYEQALWAIRTFEKSPLAAV